MTSHPQDVSSDSLAAVLNDVFAAPKYQWTQSRDPWAWIRDSYDALTRWFGLLNQEHPAIYWVLLTVLVVLLTTILVHFGYLMFRALRPKMSSPETTGGGGRAVRDAAWYLREAHRLEDQGNLLGALVMRFTSLLMDLDRRKVVQFSPAKTPIEYVHEAIVSDDVREQMRALVMSVYRHLYGGEPVTPDGLREFDHAAGRLVSSYVA